MHELSVWTADHGLRVILIGHGGLERGSVWLTADTTATRQESDITAVG